MVAFSLTGVWAAQAVAMICDTCPGDVDGNGWIMVTDITAMVDLLKAFGPPYRIPSTHPAYCPCADMDGDDWIMITDVTALVNYLKLIGPIFRVSCDDYY